MKLATKIHANEDIKTLIRLLLDKKPNEEMIVIGMGDKGKITRLINPLLGSYLTYASTEYSQSAPGQIPINLLRAVYQRIQYI